ncbi:alpha/beta hydrolase [Microbacterium saperdae]|uniref:Alpha/beta hydrolase family protein n=1 Tax=Microbacterium saperdae TaxID=69368 RepID=A0A543BNA9_9MICO|nr:alpha/beta hydrolase [Microbacterium saperdae]TQL86317.1 alpha/beta hydrolase family protein [Microbacterium saperdae]GGM48893.1 hypothetical protein GCM10010489_20410 [Microbacterium saperdae]
MQRDVLTRLFLHGAGRRGHAAWPGLPESSGTFLEFDSRSTIDDQTRALQDSPHQAIVFAHSIGAVPAALAARPMGVRGAVLVEPALYDIVRGESAIERHIGIVVEARAQAEAGNLEGFWAILRPLMFGGSFDPSTWEQEKPLAQQWAVTNLPWGHGVRAQMLGEIPTLVVTGGWNDEYEIIARRLVDDVGAEHHVLPGAAHRPQDHPGFVSVVERFELSLR